MKSLVIRKGREAALLRYNPWVFSGSVAREEDGLEDGDPVRVTDAGGRQLAIGHYQDGSIRVRVLSFGEEGLPPDFPHAPLRAAIALRATLGLSADPLTDCYRLVHAAGDGLPGLIIDRYGPVAVIQCHSIGMHRMRERIAATLLTLLAGTVHTVYDKSRGVLPDRYPATDGLLAGSGETTVTVRENGRRFVVDIPGGQKTGFFLDQRDNRWLLGSYVNGRSVLNLYAYSGGFSLYALLGGATEVTSVDQSAPAMELLARNLRENGELAGRHTSRVEDVMDYLREETTSFDIIVVDPPAFAKNKHRRHKAVQAYKRLNARAMDRLRPGGLLFTFSCSRVVDRQLFQDTLVAAALEAGRGCRILHTLRQGADHPVNLFHPEGEYLKGLVLQVD